MYFVAPDAFQVAPDLEQSLEQSRVKIIKSGNLKEVLPDVDCVYMTRIQDEYDMSGESGQINYDQFSLYPDDLKMMKPDSIILHPLPRRSEIHPEVDLDARAMYWRQLRNGLYIRAALMLYVFNQSHRLQEY